MTTEHKDYLVTGRILAPFGIHGEMKVELYTDFAERFAVGAKVWVGPDRQIYRVDRARQHKGMLLLRFAGVRDRNAAEELRGLWLYVPDTHAMPLPEDTYYLHEIIGLQVWSVDGTMLGEVVDILFTGANEVYVVRTNEGGELLLPAIDEVMLRVDLEQGKIHVKVPEGL